MSHVAALGYIRVTAPDLEAWRRYATEVLGLQVAESPGSAESLCLKQDERTYRLAVDRGAEPATTFGWEVANRTSLEALAGQLDAAGVAVKEASSEHAQSRMTEGMLLCDDPAGNACEIFYGASCEKEAFVSPTGARFVTGELGLGHAFMMVPDGEAFLKFYSLLGFRVSDYITLGPGLTATFLHCNPRHHTLAFMEIPNVSAIQHVMVEVDDQDVVGRSWDRCLSGAAPVAMTLGRHTNDRMFSFYSTSPSGMAVELGSGGVRIDDDVWSVQRFDAISYWGHAMQPVPAPEV
jgi:2,3-dihydroxybiphenyl 1,2-dioxygenase